LERRPGKAIPTSLPPYIHLGGQTFFLVKYKFKNLISKKTKKPSLPPFVRKSNEKQKQNKI